MNKKFNRHNRRNFKDKFVGNQSIEVPNAVQPESQDMSTGPALYDNRSKVAFNRTANTTVAFSKQRSYDLILDKVQVQVAGAAPIYGKLNALKSWNFGSGELGTFTAALNQKYYNNEFRTLYSVTREAIFNYLGCDYLQGTTENAPSVNKVKDSIAMRVQREHAAAILFELEAAKTWDMQISELTPATADNKDFHEISSPLMTVLMQYQHELFLYVIYLATFDRLRSALGLLQSLDLQNQYLYAHIDSQLKRSRYTSLIRNIKSTLKRRWVDVNWIKTIILPFLVWSKRTDGLNSPIVSLTPALATPVTQYKLSTVAGADGYQIPQWGISKSGADKDKIITRAVNHFDIEDLMEAVVVPKTIGEKRAAVDKWLEKQYEDLVLIDALFTTWVSNPLIIALEAMLSKLSTRPGGTALNWTQNVSPSEVAPITQFDEWEVVNSLVFNVNTLPKMDDNGYSINLPMYQYDGFDTQMIKEYFQFFYLPSNQHTIGFIRLNRKISNVFRDGHKTIISITQTEDDVTLTVTAKDGTKINETAEYACRVMQENYPKLIYHDQTGTANNIVNPQLMLYIPAKMTNRAGEALVWLKQICLLPIA